MTRELSSLILPAATSSPPFNPCVVIILVFMQKDMPKGGIRTLIALTLPYALVFAVVWTGLLVLWMSTGMDLGPQGPLWHSQQ
ncbi:MAG: AbgT family transporter [Verrucomicrobiota bacterium]|nr:AbgT family transporter [Verrucomicrobiota bacterium]